MTLFALFVVDPKFRGCELAGSKIYRSLSAQKEHSVESYTIGVGTRKKIGVALWMAYLYFFHNNRVLVYPNLLVSHDIL